MLDARESTGTLPPSGDGGYNIGRQRADRDTLYHNRGRSELRVPLMRKGHMTHFQGLSRDSIVDKRMFIWVDEYRRSKDRMLIPILLL